jgi:(E)-4-hydroxy-3-methylbut-2-enyl-diphosphate synthase
MVDLVSIAGEVERKLSAVGRERAVSGKRPLKVAVMGCVVNGPGEAREADFGVACGKGKGVIFSKGKPVKTVAEEDIIAELVDICRKAD